MIAGLSPRAGWSRLAGVGLLVFAVGSCSDGITDVDREDLAESIAPPAQADLAPPDAMWINRGEPATGGPTPGEARFDGSGAATGPVITRAPESTTTVIAFDWFEDNQALTWTGGADLTGWRTSKSKKAGGTGFFINEPSSANIAYWLKGEPYDSTRRDIPFSLPVASASFAYISATPITLQALAADGSVLLEKSLPVSIGTGCPRQYFCEFSPVSIGTESNLIASLRIHGNVNSTGLDDLKFIRLNAPPVANPAGPYDAVEGASITLDGSASTDPDLPNDAITYAWTSGADETSAASNPTFTYADNGTFTATLKVTDGNGAFDTESTTVKVANEAPKVSLTVPTEPITTGTPAAVAAAFTDAGAVDHPWEWTIDWGDETSTGGTVEEGGSRSLSGSHSYSGPGTYPVTFTVVDKDGGEGTIQRSIVVTNLPPVAEIAGPASILEGGTASFNGSGSHTTPPGGSLTYSWNSGNGAGSTQVDPTFTYPDPGTYTVSLTVTDPGGGGTATDTHTLTVDNVAPTVTAGSDLGGVPAAPVTLNLTIADPGVNDGPWAYTVTWGDDQTSTGTFTTLGGHSLQHTYASAGVFVVDVLIEDKYGAEGSDQTLVTITPPPVPDPALSWDVRITPRSIQLKGKGNGQVTAHVQRLGPDVDLRGLAAQSVVIYDAADGPPPPPDRRAGLAERKNGTFQLQVKADKGTLHFDRAELIDAGVLKSSTTRLYVEGRLADGRILRGSHDVTVKP